MQCAPRSTSSAWDSVRSVIRQCGGCSLPCVLTLSLRRCRFHAVVVSAQAAGAQEFMDTVWRGGDLYVDPEQTFKKALGAVKTKNWWILKPR